MLTFSIERLNGWGAIWRVLGILLLPATAAAQTVNCTPPPGGWTQTNRIPPQCYIYPLSNSMWANRIPVDAMQHLWNPNNYGLGTTYTSDQYAKTLMDGEGNVAVNCSGFAKAQGGAQPANCGGNMGGTLQVTSPASDGTRSNQDGQNPLYYADTTMPVYSIGTVSGGTCTGEHLTPHTCVTFHAPSGAQWTWYGGGRCFTSGTTGAPGNGQSCEYTSQCPSNYPVCLASASQTTFQPAWQDSFFSVFDQGQGLMIFNMRGSQTPPLNLPRCSGGPGTCASVCGGHAGTLSDPCPLTQQPGYTSAERYGVDKDWGWQQSSQNYSVTVNGVQEFLGAEGDNGTGEAANGSSMVRFEEFMNGIFHLTAGGAATCNSTVPTIWPATVGCVASGRNSVYPPGGVWLFLDYSDAQINAMGLSTIHKNLLLQLAHYGTIIANWGGASGASWSGFTAYSEASESGLPYLQATGQQHSIYSWFKGQQIGATSTGYHYNVSCNGGSPDNAQYNCEMDTLYGIPLETGPGGTDLSGRKCDGSDGKGGCDVSGHIHIEDPCALSGYIPPGGINVDGGQPAACVGLTTVSFAGRGSGSITSNPSGINCDHGVACNIAMATGKTITLTAAPNSGSSFAGWSGGGCSGTGTCTLTLGAIPQNVTATFNGGTTSPAPPAKPQGLNFK